MIVLYISLFFLLMGSSFSSTTPSKHLTPQIKRSFHKLVLKNAYFSVDFQPQCVTPYDKISFNFYEIFLIVDPLHSNICICVDIEKRIDAGQWVLAFKK